MSVCVCVGVGVCVPWVVDESDSDTCTLIRNILLLEDTL